MLYPSVNINQLCIIIHAIRKNLLKARIKEQYLMCILCKLTMISRLGAGIVGRGQVDSHLVMSLGSIMPVKSVGSIMPVKSLGSIMPVKSLGSIMPVKSPLSGVDQELAQHVL